MIATADIRLYSHLNGQSYTLPVNTLIIQDQHRRCSVSIKVRRIDPQRLMIPVLECIDIDIYPVYGTVFYPTIHSLADITALGILVPASYLSGTTLCPASSAPAAQPVVEPENNGSREICFWCKKQTEPMFGTLRVCRKCGR